MSTLRGIDAPRLVTKRLVLRELTLDDFEHHAKTGEDPIAMKHMSGVVDRRTAWRIFLAMTGQWRLTGAGWWAMEHEGEFAGTVGCFLRETQFMLGDDADIEVGWTVQRKFWQRGFGSEAAAAVLDWGFANVRGKRVIAYIDPPNTPSRRVAEKIGMTLEGDVPFYGEPSVRYFMTRQDWEKAMSGGSSNVPQKRL